MCTYYTSVIVFKLVCQWINHVFFYTLLNIINFTLVMAINISRIILEAKRQLIYSDDSVKEIAFDLGFNDPAYFTRFFTKATTFSPLNFKKQQKN